MDIPICKVKTGESVQYANGILSINRIDGSVDSRPLHEWTEADGVRMDSLTPEAEASFDAKLRESVPPDGIEDWKKKGHWTPGGAEGLAE